MTTNRVVPEPGHGVSIFPELDGIKDSTLQLLKSKKWSKLHVSTLKGKLEQVKMITDATGLSMRVISASKLESVGKVPKRRKDETPAITAAEALNLHGVDVGGRPRAVLVFVSHRWLRPKTEDGDMDDARGTKTKVLVEWARWFKWALRQPNETTGLLLPDMTKDPQEIYFWIDQVCVDQAGPGPEIAALPGFVACSHIMLCYHTDDYERRAWCRVERMMGYALSTAGDMMFVVKEGFQHLRQPVLKEVPWVITDPAEGHLTVESDREHIRNLTSVALASEAFTTKQVFMRMFTSTWFMSMGWGFLCCACCGLCAMIKSRKLELNKSTVTALMLQKGL
mmetsp:Transcript_19732/g.43131  ORF Transcript_19732/g.43131 Transcript_19732/m.43131 type:complete len:338 (-) Transcript_19732:1397-2410(-)|eukprot:CAMPEP_0118953628 /NCGR_PEP_ID=MMETSP1169-20130426/56901_1 /TAXON_ID=36882 /ORGANISM="Pyramimonas obovata, Strain CCMP722" /LENGTH=337 /DNA_ID=CAMNT_0006901135 /DNA_START=168 /DNA_END=1181 /DNA_ORIENTATION=-